MKRICFAALLLCFLLTGCSRGLVFQDYREIDQLDLVQTLGIDRDGDKVAVTASTTAEGGQVVLQTSSMTISRAIRELQNYTEKKYIFYGHTSHLLVGEGEARQGLARCLEFVERDSEVRLDTDLYVVQAETAENAIASCSSGEASIGDLLDSLNKDVQLMSESFVFTCGDTAEALEERGSALVAAVVLRDSGDISEREKGQSLQSSGYAIVTKDSLLGYLNRNQARGANLLMNKTGSDVIETTLGNTQVAARMTRSSSKYMPIFTDGELTGVDIRITIHCNVDDLLPPEQTVDDRTIRELETVLADMEQSYVDEVLHISQSLGSDFCGLALKIRRASPILYDRMQQSWESVFPELQIKTFVEARLERTYDAGLIREKQP